MSPEFLPVIESTELGRSLPRRVASAMASRIWPRIQIWLAPTGTLISKVGMTGIRLLKYDDKPCFTADGVVMRETHIEAFRN